MAATIPESHQLEWLSESVLDGLASLAETSPSEFDEQFDSLAVLQRVQVRRFLFERHKDGFGLPPRFVARPFDAPLESGSPASDNGDGASGGMESASSVPAVDADSLDALMAEPEAALPTEVSSLDDLMAAADSSGSDEAMDLDSLFGDDSGGDSDEAGSLDDLFGDLDSGASDGDAVELDDLLGDDAQQEASDEEKADEPAGRDIPSDYGIPRPLKMSVEELITSIQTLELFQGISHAELAAIASKMDAVEYGPDALLCRDGDQGDVMWVIQEGGIRVLPGGKDLGIVIPPGGFVGEMSPLDSSPRSATLMTAGTTTLLRYTREGFLATIRDAPDAGGLFLRNVLKVQQDRVRNMNARALDEAVARERAEGEIRQAEATQKLALPDGVPTFGDSEFAVVYTGARGVSGDYYDFIEFEDDPDRLIVIFAIASARS